MTRNNQSISKALQIIEIMAQADGPMRLQDVSSEIGLPASTVIRFLGALSEHNYVSQDAATLQYSLTLKFCRLGHLVGSQVSVRDVVRPYLVRLVQEFRESASLAVEEELNVLYVDSVEGPGRTLKALQKIGHVAPMHCTGVGKVLLLDYTDSQLDELIATRGLERLTKNTIASRQSLLRELRRISQIGTAVDNEECEIGVRCVAAPLRDYTGKISAAISLTGPVIRMSERRIEAIRRAILAAAREVSGILGYVEEKPPRSAPSKKATKRPLHRTA